MYTVALVNAPFAGLRLPSLALTQLKSVLDARFGSAVSSEVLYLNHDFAQAMGVDVYQHIAVDMEAPYNGFGDWFFRQAAFPELEDNSEIYFNRFFPHRTEQNRTRRRVIEEKRLTLDTVLNDLITRHGLDRKDLVGFTSMFSQNVACFALARLIKARSPNTLIVMGGANCETPMGEEIAKNVDAVDYVFSGPGVKSLPDFVQATLDGDLPARERIRGVYSKANCSRLLTPAAGNVGEELPLDVQIDLDYDGFLDSLDEKFAGGNIEPILLFETSRGCWWGQRAHCTFCGLNSQSMTYRSMNADNALALIRSLFRYADRVSRLQCVDNIMPKHYAKEVFARLDTPSHMKIFYEVKADMSDEDLTHLSNGRVREVQPGIEALATPTLKLMKKGTTVFQNLRFLAACTARDIFPCWSLLVGFPGEGADTYRKYIDDIPRLVHLPPPSGVYPVRPDRYSPFQTRAAEFGFDLRPVDFYELVYPFSRASLENLAYFFRDYNFDAEYFVVMVEWFARVRAQVDLWKKRWDRNDHALPPMLYLDESGGVPIVHDSRDRTTVEHRLTAAGREILAQLMKQRRTADLAAVLPPGTNLASELARLEELGLVFHEGDHTMSLVFMQQPTWSGTFEDGWSWAT
jgi:magnesium-protoporphyrin IX monomethyl ester (oxidative) cyclase